MPESTKPSSSKVRRVLGVVGGVAVVLLLAWIFFHKSNTWSGWIRDAKDKEALKNLRQETDPGLVSKLESALYDADYPRESRVIAGRLLIEKEQRALVEKALTAPALDPRTIAIEVLSRDSFFGKQYADDPAYRVHETLLEWLKGDARTDADAAFAVLSRMVPPGGKLEGDVLAAVRALLASPAPKVRTEAAKTLAAYRDCESAAFFRGIQI